MVNSNLGGLKNVSSQLSYLDSPHLHTNMAISVFLSKFFPFFFLFILRTFFPDPVELWHVRGHFEPWHTSCCYHPPHPLQHLDLCPLNSQAAPQHQEVSSKTFFKYSPSSSIHQTPRSPSGTGSFASQSQALLAQAWFGSKMKRVYCWNRAKHQETFWRTDFLMALANGCRD